MVEFRKPFAEKYHFIISASHGGNAYFGKQMSILEANDTMVIIRSASDKDSYSFLRIGIERQIKTSMFYYGADFILGYRINEWLKGNDTYKLDNYGNWIRATPIENLENQQYATFKDHYLIPGLQLHVSMDVPLGSKDRFLLNLRYAFQYGIYKHIKRTDINDPLNEFFGPFQHFSSYFDDRFSIGLKYKLGKKESSTAEDINL